MGAPGSIPQMRTSPSRGARGLSVSWAVDDDLGVVSLRGAVSSDNLDVLLGAVDAVIRIGVRALVVDGDAVGAWTIRGLEVAVLAANRPEFQQGFAVSGLSAPAVDLIRRQWPGVDIGHFTYPTSAAAITALAGASLRTSGSPIRVLS